MPRVKTLTNTLALWVFANDHAPPHFHLVSPETDALVDIRTLRVIEGTYRRRDLAMALEWAAASENQAKLMAERSRLNEHG